MARRFVLASAATVSLFLVPLPANAALVWTSGTLHAQASAFNGTASASANPPDVILSGPSGSHSATATTPPITVTGSGSTTFNLGPRSIQITGGTLDYKEPVGSANSSALATGSVSFSETATDILTAYISPNQNFTSESVTIKDALNLTVLSMSSDSSSSPTPLTLTPGAYTLSWTIGSKYFVGTSGSSTVSFILPEPASAATLALFIIPLLLRKIHVRTA
jgi:hypothetical protein